MPLKQTKYGKECPLGKFEITSMGGAYTSDPVVACLECNFRDIEQEEFDLDKICMCPEDMTWPKYDKLKKDFLEQNDGLASKQDFLKYVEEARK